jgi:hypothetical protein
MGVFGALAGSAGGAALGNFANKKLSTRKDGGQTKYGKYLESDIGKKLNLATVGGIAGKALGALLPFQQGGVVMVPPTRIKPRVGYRLSQGINPLVF